MTYANEFTANINAHTDEELAPYLGQHIAWSEDGTKILFSDPDPRALVEKVKNLEQGTYVLGYLPLPQVVFRPGEWQKHLEAECGHPLSPEAVLQHALCISESADYPLVFQLANDHPGTTAAGPVAERVRTTEPGRGPGDAG